MFGPTTTLKPNTTLSRTLPSQANASARSMFWPAAATRWTRLLFTSSTSAQPPTPIAMPAFTHVPNPARATASAPTPTSALARRIYESRVEAHLRKHGVSQQEFMTALVEQDADAACLAAMSEGTGVHDGAEPRAPMVAPPPTLIASLLLVEDFEAFAQMMQQRALEQE